MASAEDTVGRVSLDIISSLAPMEKAQVSERLLGAILCADFDAQQEAEVLDEIARRITAVNAHIRKKLEHQAGMTEPRDPGTAH